MGRRARGEGSERPVNLPSLELHEVEEAGGLSAWIEKGHLSPHATEHSVLSRLLPSAKHHGTPEQSDVASDRNA